MVISTIFSFMKKENVLKIITLNERGEEAASRPTCNILHFVCQGNFIFIAEKSGNFERMSVATM